MYCDPAYADTKDACYSAIIAVGLIRKASLDDSGEDTYYYFIFDLWAEKTTNCAIRHLEMYRHFRTQYPDCNVGAMVEANVSQGVHLERIYGDTISQEPQYMLYMPEFDKRNKGNKTQRISMLIQPFRQGSIHCNQSLELTESYAIFTSQLTNFPEGTLDVPDALEGAIFHFNDMGTPIKAQKAYVPQFEQSFPLI